jgi:DNA primase
MADQIEEIKRKLDIVDVISSYTSLTKSGKNYKALCPFHSEKTPSFMVSPTLQIFKCFGCGEGGDVISFYSKIEGVSFGEALKETAKRAGVKLVSRKQSPEEKQKEKLYEINRLASDYFHHLLTKHNVGKSASRLLKKRGVSRDSIEEFNLGYAPRSWDSLGRFITKKGYTVTDLLESGLANKKDKGRGYYDFFRGRVMFPLRSSTGRVIGFSGRALGDEQPKYINTTETPVFEKRRLLYNLDLAKQEIKKKKSAILVEGELDAIALYDKGIKNVVATKGTALSSEQITTLSRFANSLLLCFDRDAAGLEATKKGIFIAQSAGFEVKAVLLPEDKDPDEAIHEDEAGFKKLVEKAPPIFDFYLESALSRFDPSAPQGKKKIAGEILPVVKSLANEVEKAGYLSRLAEELDVEEEILWKQLDKEEAIEDEKVFTSAVKKASKSAQLPKKEAYIFAILFSVPVNRIKSTVRKIALEDVTDPKLTALLEALKGYLKDIKRFRLENFSGKLDQDLRRVFEELVLIPLPTSDIEEEFAKALSAVKRGRFIRERKELLVQVRKAEKDGKPAQVKKLQRQIQELSLKIDGKD